MIDFLDELGNFKQKKFTLQNVKFYILKCQGRTTQPISIYTPPLSRIWKTLLGVIFPSVYCGSILLFIKKQKKVGIHTLHTT